jgi:hypothetical protein
MIPGSESARRSGHDGSGSIQATVSAVQTKQNHDEHRLLGCDAVWLLYEQTFRRNEKIYVLPLKVIANVPSSPMRRLLVTFNVVPSLPILVTLMREALSSSETSVLTRATQRNIPEDAILHCHRRKNLKSYIALTGWTL